MAPQPVRVANGSWELLAVYDVGEGDTDAAGHPTRRYAIYAGVVKDCGEASVVRLEETMCAAKHAAMLAKFS